MTRRDFGKPAFSLRKKRFVKHMPLSLLGILDSCLAAMEAHLGATPAFAYGA